MGHPDDAIEEAAVARMRKSRIRSGEGDLRVARGEFHRHSDVSMDGGNDGSLVDQWRYMLDAGDMDWVGCCDHDNGGGREYSWWITQKLTDIYHAPGRFVPMFSYERSLPYPEGHRNVVMAQRGIRNLPRLPRVTAENDPVSEPVVEIYQGLRQNYEMPGAPRSNKDGDSIGGWRPLGFINLALEKGYRMSFQASSDHVSTHMSYCNILAKDLSRQSLLDAFKKRHVYGATDNILADFRSGSHIMGDAFVTSRAPELRVKLAGTAPFARVHVIKDNKYVYTTEPRKAAVDSPGATSRRPRARPRTTTCAASSRTARSCGCPRCGSRISRGADRTHGRFSVCKLAALAGPRDSMSYSGQSKQEPAATGLKPPARQQHLKNRRDRSCTAFIRSSRYCSAS